MTPAKIIAMMHGSYSPEAVALFARMTTQPSVSRKRLIDLTIRYLITNAVWSDLDALYLFAAHDSQAGALNWKSSSFGMTGGAFATDLGFTGVLDSNCTLPSGSMNNHSYGVWLNSDTPTNNRFAVGNSSSGRLNPDNASSLMVLNDADTNNDLVSIVDGLGFSAASRTSGSGFTIARNTTHTAVTRASSSWAPTGEFAFLSDAPGGSPRTARAAAGVLGIGLSGAKLTALYTALNSYLTTIGAA